MNHNPSNATKRLQTELDELRGEICALRGMIAVLVGHLALSGRDPNAKREEILRHLESMLPGALAVIEQDATPAASAGFERAVETVTHLARTAIRFETPARPQPGLAARPPPRRDPDPER